MAYISRELEKSIVDYFSGSQCQGLILAGIVGCGKTTLIRHCLEKLSASYEVFEFTGDDTLFRSHVQQDSQYLHELIRGKTQSRVLVFVDEIQKSEAIFDAVKILFDKGRASFIVSGSNPAYLNFVAKRRLQRRAAFQILYPLSIPELLGVHRFFDYVQSIVKLFEGKELQKIPRIEKTAEIKALIDKYFLVGGLPLSFLNPKPENSLREIQKTFDRGFTPIRENTTELSDTVAVELAQLHAREFTYLNIMNKTRVRHRQVINQVIEGFYDHGYIGCVTPYLFEEQKKTYLKKYFFIDPGLVTYLTGSTNIKSDLGYRIEGLVYSRLLFHLQGVLTKNKGIYFYKHYATTSQGQLRFSKGEVDAIFQAGSQITPIEIKATSQWADVDLAPIEALLRKHQLPYGLILYGGEPRKKNNIYFWPYWML